MNNLAGLQFHGKKAINAPIRGNKDGEIKYDCTEKAIIMHPQSSPSRPSRKFVKFINATIPRIAIIPNKIIKKFEPLKKFTTTRKRLLSFKINIEIIN